MKKLILGLIILMNFIALAWATYPDGSSPAFIKNGYGIFAGTPVIIYNPKDYWTPTPTFTFTYTPTPTPTGSATPTVTATGTPLVVNPLNSESQTIVAADISNVTGSVFTFSQVWPNYSLLINWGKPAVVSATATPQFFTRQSSTGSTSEPYSAFQGSPIPFTNAQISNNKSYLANLCAAAFGGVLAVYPRATSKYVWIVANGLIPTTTVGPVTMISQGTN